MTDHAMNDAGLLTVGWREWLALPDLGIPALKAKIDTGARSSALHVDTLEVIERAGRSIVRFSLRPGAERERIHAEADIIDIRPVTDSGGQTRHRPFIRTRVELCGLHWSIDMNLTSRTNMLFPMLLGRTAMAGRLCIDPAQSYRLGNPETGC